jgi:hypothetical protein
VAVGVAANDLGALRRRRRSHVARSASASERRHDAPSPAPFRTRKKSETHRVMHYATCCMRPVKFGTAFLRPKA